MKDIGPIIQAIEQAFAGVPRGSITLHEAEVVDSYGTEAERQRARKRDTEADWCEVPDSSIEECQNALPHLDPESWRFYLPAYMRHGLRHVTSPRCGQTLEHTFTAEPGSATR